MKKVVALCVLTALSKEALRFAKLWCLLADIAVLGQVLDIYFSMLKV